MIRGQHPIYCGDEVNTGSNPVLTTKNKKNMKNNNIKALIGLVSALALVYVIGQILLILN